jgi:dissimilatory sulfite reductase (desulfoviridin) alpha/beta subunit
MKKSLPIQIPDQEITKLKESALFVEKGKTKFSSRLLVIGGQLTAQQLRHIATLSARYGDGTIHLTTRQGVEIPHISYEKLRLFQNAIAKSPLQAAQSGKCVRAITACPGTYCKFGTIDTQKVAAEIFKRFGNRKNLPHKFKIAVSGCRHCCSKPQENDLGVMGVGKYAVFVGGMAGKTPRWGNRLPFDIKEKNELFKIIDAAIKWYNKNGNEKERFGATIERIGFDQLLKTLESISGSPS